MAVKHAFVSTIADSPDETDVRISDWNAEHNITPDTIANVLSDHDKANHDSLGIDHTSLTNIGTNSHDTIDSHLLATTGVHGIGALDDGLNKLILNGTSWEVWIGGVRVAIFDTVGNLHIKGIIISEDDTV